MKKTFFALLFIFLSLAVCGCSDKTTDITPVIRGISFSAELTYYNECCEADVRVAEDGTAAMEITSPDTIKGLTFRFDGDGLTAEYLGLEYKTDFNSLPEGNACIRLYEILTDAADGETPVTAEGDDYCILREDEKGYKLYVGATGLPIKAEDPLNGFTAVFKGVTLQKNGS